MILEAKKLLRERKRMTLSDLAIHFQSEPGTMEVMMRVLVEKGQITRSVVEGCSGGCGGCGQDNACAEDARAKLIIYDWAG